MGGCCSRRARPLTKMLVRAPVPDRTVLGAVNPPAVVGSSPAHETQKHVQTEAQKEDILHVAIRCTGVFDSWPPGLIGVVLSYCPNPEDHRLYWFQVRPHCVPGSSVGRVSMWSRDARRECAFSEMGEWVRGGDSRPMGIQPPLFVTRVTSPSPLVGSDESFIRVSGWHPGWSRCRSLFLRPGTDAFLRDPPDPDLAEFPYSKFDCPIAVDHNRGVLYYSAHAILRVDLSTLRFLGAYMDLPPPLVPCEYGVVALWKPPTDSHPHWLRASPPPRPPFFHSGPRYLMLLGGSHLNNRVRTVQMYDFTTETWSVAPFALPCSMSRFLAAVVDHCLYVLAGEGDSGPLRSMSVLDLLSLDLEWKQLPDLPAAFDLQNSVLYGHSRVL
jgi:hypothetical protein